MTHILSYNVTVERIRELLRETKTSQNRYAAILQVTQPTVSNKLAGIVKFTAKDIYQTSIAFEVSADYLYGLTDEKREHVSQ